MNNTDDAIEKMVENIEKVMEKDLCRMISATIIAGNICGGSDTPLVLEDQDNVLGLIKENINKYGQQINIAIQTTLLVWSVEPEIRNELFSKDELSISVAMPTISRGGIEWYMLSKSDVVDRQELLSFFQFVKELFIKSSFTNKGNHEKYDEFIAAWDNILSIV